MTAIGYALRRTAFAAAQLAVITLASFALFSVPAGDFYSTATVEDPRRSSADIEALRQSSGQGDAFLMRYARWVRSCASGEWGTSLAYQMPVRELLRPRIGNTLRLVLPALLLVWPLGLALSLAAARYEIAAWQPLAAAAALVPDVAAVAVLLWVGVGLGLSPSGIALPLAGLCATLLPLIALQAGTELRAARRLEFVRLASSRGIRGSRLWMRYILPAAANPLLSLAGLSIAGAIGSSFAVEALTGWPGLGPLFLEAVQARDYPVVQAVLAGLACVLIVSNLAVDLALYRLDPRIRVADA